jgi:hypothetical protein
MESGHSITYEQLVKISKWSFIFIIVVCLIGILYGFLVYREIDIECDPDNIYNADLDNDSDLDIIMVEGYGYYRNTKLLIMINNNGNFDDIREYRLDNFCRCITLIDFNNDSYLDIVAPKTDFDDLMFYRNDGKGRFSKILELETIRNPSEL